jgi:tRNA1Val (adenine37-N6)-methyltransferase
MSMFRLQQFSVEQNLAGMKVCSDSLLFGAMIPLAGAQSILDIGTGTGLLALMQAQKAHTNTVFSPASAARITAIELTTEAASEAQKNFNASPWSETIELIQQDIQSYSQQQKVNNNVQSYDLIICNPPFFEDHSRTQSDNLLRSIARHTDTLSYAQLSEAISNLLAINGNAYILIPSAAITAFSNSAQHSGLVVLGITHIAESIKHPAKVSVIQLIHKSLNVALSSIKTVHVKITTRTLYKFDKNKIHTDEVKNYLAPFLLRYGK